MSGFRFGPEPSWRRFNAGDLRRRLREAGGGAMTVHFLSQNDGFGAKTVLSWRDGHAAA
ncbi:hypothetical protein ART_2998 [Arthrobacter sp. PAMC 25486]|nr:hypothetical protein ART_2998 [Arthrobacter sp. PAMC 25486]